MKLWEKGIAVNETIDHFTAGKDRVLDERLAKYDIRGSIAHAKMLRKVGLITSKEERLLCHTLSDLLLEVKDSSFKIPQDFEDIHTYVEHRLTVELGDLGKKIHTARSRNDQVLVDLHMYLKDEIDTIQDQVRQLGLILLDLARQYNKVPLPGYTHFQIAMPSSFGLWFSAYAELLADDLDMLHTAYKIVDQNPLGSAAGYGTSFPIDRKYTTDLLGFKTMKYNSVAAQMSRGKMEQRVGFGLSSVASTLSKLSMDVVLYLSQNFGFIKFPDHLTTGSSIMPHKKNPDAFELVRAKCNKVQCLPIEIQSIAGNLPSGYHRDFQVLKGVIFDGIDDLKDCLRMLLYMLPEIKVNEQILSEDKYHHLFTVDSVAQQVAKGVPFRDAYKEVAQSIEDGTYQTPGDIQYSHHGSMGNLCLTDIRKKLFRNK